MGYHVRQFAEPRVKVQQARQFIDSLAKAMEGLPYDHAGLIARDVAMLRQRNDSYLCHEYLEAENRAIYFEESARRCEAQGLRHLADAVPSSTAMGILPPRMAEALRQWGSDAIRREQYLDFLVNRTFRRSLLVREEVTLQPTMSPQTLMRMHLSSLIRPASAKPDVASMAKESFTNADGVTMTASSPLTKAALCVLCEAYPGLLPFDELVGRVRSRLSGLKNASPITGEDLAAAMLECYRGHMVDAHLNPPLFTTAVSERPTAFALARHQASKGLKLISCLRHFVVELGVFERPLLAQLDGTRTQDDLLAWLEQAVAAGQLAVQHNNRPITDPAQVRQKLTELMQSALKRLAASALLVG